jgi:hypothetical protein
MLRDKALVLAQNLVTVHKLDQQVMASPFIDFLISLFKTLLPMLISCIPVAAANGAGVVDAMQKLGPIQRWLLRKTISDQIGDQAMQNILAGPLKTEVLKLGVSLTADEAQAAIDEL